MDAFGPTSAVVAELFERLRRNRVLARNVFSTRWHRGCLRRCAAKHRLNGVCTSGTGSRTDVWRSSEGRKGIWRATGTVRRRALWRARNISGKLRPKQHVKGKLVASRRSPATRGRRFNRTTNDLFTWTKNRYVGEV